MRYLDNGSGSVKEVKQAIQTFNNEFIDNYRDKGMGMLSRILYKDFQFRNSL
jgi:hypothetical protein